jgi:hypothetical protein
MSQMANLPDMKTTKNVRLAILALALCSASYGAEVERVVAIRNNADLENVNHMLAAGWTVKHQTNAASGTGGLLGGSHREVAILTIVAPSPERIAQLQAAKKADFERRRAEYLAKKVAAEKQ